MKKLVAQFNATHSDVTVTQEYYGNADYALQKVLTSIAGGKPPDLAYLYGSWAANIAKSPKTVALNGFISGDPSFGWNDFWPAERAAATVNGRIVGIPALVLSSPGGKKTLNVAGGVTTTAPVGGDGIVTPFGGDGSGSPSAGGNPGDSPTSTTASVAARALLPCGKIIVPCLPVSVFRSSGKAVPTPERLNA